MLEIGRALAVAATTKASKRDGLRDGLVRRAGRAEEPPRVEDADERREGEGERKEVGEGIGNGEEHREGGDTSKHGEGNMVCVGARLAGVEL